MPKQYLIKIQQRLFNQAYLPYLNAQQPIQIFFGGSSSGKSKFLAQRCIHDLMQGGRNYLCVRNTGNTLKMSVMFELEKVINEWGVNGLFETSTGIVRCINGYVAILKGLDDPEKIKSITAPKGVITDIWIEEATETVREAYKQLTKRLRGLSDVIKRVTLSFNPILKSHWIYEDFFGTWNDSDKLYETDKLLILKTTHIDNQFLTDQDHKALENEKDSYFYDVYTLGNWGMLGDMIFDNWEVADLTDKEYMFDIFDHGLDFGFSNDPTAYVKTYFHSATKTLYVYREYCNKEVTNEQIANDIIDIVDGDIVICDSAEPKSITELNSHGLSATAANKGKDSVMHGIQWLKGLKIVLDKSCQNAINNFKQYHWLKDKQGNVLNKPVDRVNDFIDAIRYANECHMIEYDDDMPESVTNFASKADW